MRRQRGNALIYTLLALAIAGLGMAGYTSSRQIEIKTQAGQAEATVLEMLRNAANSAISDNVTAIQRGQPMTKVVGTVTTTVANRLVGGELVWEPTTAQLVQMGYLPAGWNTTTSNLNNAPYAISFQRTPAGCLPINCNIDGAVVIQGPIADPGTGRTDGVVVGPILTKIGADSAVSLTTNPTLLTGYGGTWSFPNPLGGTQGVVAVRIGTASSAFASFVRIGDLRDPDLAGNLTAAGNLTIGGTTQLNGAVTANAPVTIAGSPLNVANAAGTNCTTIAPTGIITVNCVGAVNAVTGIFSTSVATGQVETNTILVNAGDFLIRGPAGTLVQINAAGDLAATGNLSGQQLQLTNPVVEFSPCTPGALASLVGGGIAVCSPQGQFVGAVRYGANKGVCGGDGSLATDPITHEGLTCRNGHWAPASSQSSASVFMGSFLVGNNTALDMPACRDTGVAPPTPLLYLMPANELVAPVMNRTATQHGTRANNGSGYFVGGTWTVELTGNGPADPLDGNTALAMTYCLYNY